MKPSTSPSETTACSPRDPTQTDLTPNSIPHGQPRTRDKRVQVSQQPRRGQKRLLRFFAQAYRFVHHGGQAIRHCAQLAPVLDSPEQGLEPLCGPWDREGENDAVPPDEGDPISQQGLEGLSQLCFLGRRKGTRVVLLSSRQRCRWDHGTVAEGDGGSCSFLSCSRDGKPP